MVVRYPDMDINDKAVDNISQWLGQIGNVAPGAYGRILKIAAFVLFVYVKLPPSGRAIADRAAISALCLTHGLPISPYDADQVLRLLQEKRAIGQDGHVPIDVWHAINSMA
jgi:hypothetical protein